MVWPQTPNLASVMLIGGSSPFSPAKFIPEVSVMVSGRFHKPMPLCFEGSIPSLGTNFMRLKRNGQQLDCRSSASLMLWVRIPSATPNLRGRSSIG